MTVKCTLTESELKFLAAKYVMETLDIKGEPAPYKVKESRVNIVRLSNGEYAAEITIEARDASKEPQECSRLVEGTKNLYYA
jgi:hypothetical protein